MFLSTEDNVLLAPHFLLNSSRNLTLQQKYFCLVFVLQVNILQEAAFLFILFDIGMQARQGSGWVGGLVGWWVTTRAGFDPQPHSHSRRHTFQISEHCLKSEKNRQNLTRSVFRLH